MIFLEFAPIDLDARGFKLLDLGTDTLNRNESIFAAMSDKKPLLPRDR